MCLLTCTLNESPSEKEGKYDELEVDVEEIVKSLNESPSEKEGKSDASATGIITCKCPQ